jgi:hypothetical protein
LLIVESHGDNGDDDTDWKKLTRSPELSGNHSSGDIWELAGGMEEGARISRISN